MKLLLFERDKQGRGEGGENSGFDSVGKPFGLEVGHAGIEIRAFFIEDKFVSVAIEFLKG